MIRRISTKWVLTVLAAVLLPFLGFAWYVNVQMANRHWDSVFYFLTTRATEMADRLDAEVRERQLDIQSWTTNTPMTEWTIGDYDGQQAAFKSMLQAGFNSSIVNTGIYDLIVAVNARGELVVSSEIDLHGVPLDAAVLERLKERDYSREPWFERAMSGVVTRVDHHRSDLLPPVDTTPGEHPENDSIGFAVPVHTGSDAKKPVVGVVYALMSWSRVQALIGKPERPVVPGLAAPDLYRTAYTWLWLSDCDTIVAHPNKDLYTKRVSLPPVDLPQLVTAARSADVGLYPAYTFNNVRRNAAFKHCADQEHGGFGWVVGIGIDDKDVTVTVDELQALLTKATILVLAIVIVFTVFVAKRTTRPILALQEQTRRVAAGDLDASVAIASNDELGDLGRSFNEMTRELKDSRAKLIRAEKDAAWREMARQVAHEIKNPLTPISLSVTLLERAKKEGSPEFDSIFERTTTLVQRQVENMRKIAADFSAFAGARKPRPERFALAALVDEVLDLNDAWARESRVTVTKSGVGGQVCVDRGELRRVLINLVSNALEAMPTGGTLDVELGRRTEGSRAWITLSLRDSGVGLSETARAKLFEPYFTTRTHGTGLGLAIARRLIEEMNGRITLEPRPDADAKGTIAFIELPEDPEPAGESKGDA